MSRHYEESYLDPMTKLPPQIGEVEVDGKKKEVRKFATGAIRDVDTHKEDYIEGVSWVALQRYAKYMTEKANIYGKGNWQKGLSSSCYLESLTRHLQKFLLEWQYGILQEKSDHLSGICFNLLGLMHELELYKHGKGRCEIPQCYKDLYPEYDGPK